MSAIQEKPDLGMAEAFGCDPILEASVRSLVEEHGIKTVCETGSWRGYTAVRFAEFVEAVHTIDVDPGMYEWASRTIADRPAARAWCGDSAATLRTLIPWIARPAFYYLDAHWFDRWPILDEIAAIAELDAGPCVIVVHDIRVPDRDFKFDTYGGQALTFEYLKPSLDKLKFPWKHSFNREADGHRIGAMFVEPV